MRSNAGGRRPTAQYQPSTPMSGADGRPKEKRKMFKRLAKMALALGVLATVGITMIPHEAEAQNNRCYRDAGDVLICR
jgi:hypothetical protein